MTFHAPNGGGGPPNGGSASGGTAGQPGAAAVTGAGADRPLLGESDAELRTPTRPRTDDTALIESTVKATLDILNLNQGGDLRSIMNRQLQCLEEILDGRVSLRCMILMLGFLWFTTDDLAYFLFGVARCLT